MTPNTTMAGQNSKLIELKKELLEHIKNRAFIHLEKPITLSSGGTSNIYFDGKQITMFPESAVLFARAIIEMVDWSKVDAIGGPTLGADPIATAVSTVAFLEKKMSVPVFIVRKEPKKHGLQKMIEGCALKKGARVVVVEDVVTSGRSVLEAIKVIEEINCVVSQVVCLVDREEGGTQKLSPYHFTPLFLRSEVEKK